MSQSKIVLFQSNWLQMDFCLVFKLETLFFQRETNNFVFKATLSHKNYLWVKFRYSEKATKICPSSANNLTLESGSQIFVAFSEYLNFTKRKYIYTNTYRVALQIPFKLKGSLLCNYNFNLFKGHTISEHIFLESWIDLKIT